MVSPIDTFPVEIQHELHSEVVILRYSAIVLLAVGFVSLALRIYVRARLIHAFGYDDWFMLLTFLLFFIECWFLTLGIGFVPFTLWTREMMKRSVLYGYIFYYICMVTFKISLGLFFLRVFPINRVPRIIIYVVVALNIAFGVARFIYILVDECHVIAEFVPDASTCTTSGFAFVKLGVFITLLAAMTDVVFAGLAIWAIRQMSLPRMEQAIAAFLLLLGTVSGLASFVRFAVLLQERDGNMVVQAVMLARWSVIELGQGIIATSFATLRPLLREIYRQLYPSLVTPRDSGEANVPPVNLTARPSTSRRWTSDELFLTMGRFKSVEAAENELNNGTDTMRTHVRLATFAIPKVPEEFEEDLENGMTRNGSTKSIDSHLRDV